VLVGGLRWSILEMAIIIAVEKKDGFVIQLCEPSLALRS